MPFVCMRQHGNEMFQDGCWPRLTSLIKVDIHLECLSRTQAASKDAGARNPIATPCFPNYTRCIFHFQIRNRKVLRMKVIFSIVSVLLLAGVSAQGENVEKLGWVCFSGRYQNTKQESKACNDVVPVFRTVFVFSLVEVFAFVFRLPWILACG